MKCPACVLAGTPSRLDVSKMPPKPAPVERFYDEAGNLHVHDHTEYSEVYTCSNHHGYLCTWQSGCCCKGCAWNEKASVTEAYRPLGEQPRTNAP